LAQLHLGRRPLKFPARFNPQAGEGRSAPGSANRSAQLILKPMHGLDLAHLGQRWHEFRGSPPAEAVRNVRMSSSSTALVVSIASSLRMTPADSAAAPAPAP